MDEMEMVAQLGKVDPLRAEVLEEAEVVLRAALATAQEPASPRFGPRHPERRARRRTLVGVAVAIAMAAAVGGFVAAGTGTPGSRTTPRQATRSGPASRYVAAGKGTPSSRATPRQAPRPVGRGHAKPAVLTASKVRLIASASVAAASSGTVVETERDSINGVVPAAERDGLAPSTTDVTFSGGNVNYALVSSSSSAKAVQYRVVDGQLYVYFEGQDLQMHWYHDTAPHAAAGVAIPNPRTLLHALSPKARLKDLGQETIGGQELTHLRATNPRAIGHLGLPNLTAPVTSFNVWVDSDNVVRQMRVSSSYIDRSMCPMPDANASVSTETDQSAPSQKCAPATVGTTLDVHFAHLGHPESVTIPSGAIDEQGVIGVGK